MATWYALFSAGMCPNSLHLVLFTLLRSTLSLKLQHHARQQLWIGTPLVIKLAGATSSFARCSGQSQVQTSHSKQPSIHFACHDVDHMCSVSKLQHPWCPRSVRRRAGCRFETRQRHKLIARYQTFRPDKFEEFMRADSRGWGAGRSFLSM